jgi:hypothetical protein
LSEKCKINITGCVKSIRWRVCSDYAGKETLYYLLKYLVIIAPLDQSMRSFNLTIRGKDKAAPICK